MWKTVAALWTTPTKRPRPSSSARKSAPAPLMAEQAIVKAAQQKATEMLASAQAQSREMRATVTGYCENMLRRTEEQLAQSLTDVKTVRTTLRQTSKKGLAEKRQPRGEN